MIGFIDSGTGGLSLIRELKTLNPSFRMIYYADNANFPYGLKSKEEMESILIQILHELSCFELEAIFLACHTASIQVLDRSLPCITLPQLTETALKNAPLFGKIALLGSKATILSNYYQNFLSLHYKEAIIKGFEGQTPISIIETGTLTPQRVEKELQELFDFNPDFLILCSTHFSFVKDLLKSLFPRTEVIDPATMAALTIQKEYPHLFGKESSIPEDIYLLSKPDPLLKKRLENQISITLNHFLKKSIDFV